MTDTHVLVTVPPTTNVLYTYSGPRGAQGEPGATGPAGEGLALKGWVPTTADLPNDAAVGDTYMVEADGLGYVYGEAGWSTGVSLQGPQGDTGPQGPAGPQGVKGDTGSQGPQGPQGATGAAGSQGVQGPKGDTGAQGPQGATGPAGSTGAQGPQGAKGDTGATGPGVAAGGTTNQILAKNSNTDYDTKWVDAPSGGTDATNLSVTAKTSTSLDIASDTGTDATMPAADGTYAGLLTAAGYTKLAGIDSGATAAGATGDAFAASHPGGNQHIDWTADQGATNIHAGNIPDLSATYAPAAKGVTNGDSHDHNGGDGGQIAYSSLSGTPTLGTAAAKDIPSTGNASATQVVYGSDTRLSDARAPTSHDHASNKLTQANTHESVDTDTATTALHHTLGTGANQAAAGNHGHGDISSILVMPLANLPEAGSQSAVILYIAY